MADKTHILPEKAEKAAESLQDFFDKGRASLRRLKAKRERDPDARQHGRKLEMLAVEAQHAGLNPDLMQKAWRLAAQYEPEQIAAICRRVRERPAQFGYSHLVKLLSIADRGLRQKLIDQAIDQQWSVDELQRAIQARRKRRPNVGKKPRVPEDPLEALLAFQGICMKFNRWCAVALDKLPRKVQRLTRIADIAVREAKQAACDRIDQHRLERREH